MPDLHDKDTRNWKRSFQAYSKKGTQYTAYSEPDTKELFYAHPTKPLLYSGKGELLGFRGSDNKFHFHEPEKGWGSLNMDKYRNVGDIVNKYLGKPGSSMEKYGQYSTVKSMMSKAVPQNIRRTSIEDNLIDSMKKY